MIPSTYVRGLFSIAVILVLAAAAPAPPPVDVQHATLGESDRSAPEISTAELQGILSGNGTRLFDARPSREFANGRLPMEDHNTRIVVIDADVQRARFVAQALAREAFHNVSYFPRPFPEAMAAAQPEDALRGAIL
jgi:rhodanese-related sulfurtransferase